MIGSEMGSSSAGVYTTGCHTSFSSFLENGEWRRGTLSLNGGGLILGD